MLKNLAAFMRLRMMFLAIALPVRELDELSHHLRPSYYTCFISYSWADKMFVDQLYTDLHRCGVPIWLDRERMKIGEVIRERVDQSIGERDKLLVVLSRHSVVSTWVQYEVEKALEMESARHCNVLLPIRIDPTMQVNQGSWAERLHHRHIGNFEDWQRQDSYHLAFDHLLRDLHTS